MKLNLLQVCLDMSEVAGWTPGFVISPSACRCEWSRPECTRHFPLCSIAHKASSSAFIAPGDQNQVNQGQSSTDFLFGDGYFWKEGVLLKRGSLLGLYSERSSYSMDGLCNREDYRGSSGCFFLSMGRRTEKNGLRKTGTPVLWWKHFILLLKRSSTSAYNTCRLLKKHTHGLWHW